MENDVIELVRYAYNRKIYDKVRKGYVTLSNIEELARSGKRFRVVDSKTRADYTVHTLLRLLYEKQRDAAENIDPKVLREVVKRTYETVMMYVNMEIHG